MKRKHFLQRMFSGSLPVLLACGLLASCDKGEMTHTEGTPLPEGKYPLVLTARGLQAVAEYGRTSAPGTRGTTDNDWEGVSTVAVQVDGVVKEYAVAPASDKKTASLIAADPFYWQTSDEMKSIKAWYPYSLTEPAQWTVKADQSRKENYEASDLILGELELSFADKDNPEKNKLAFTHRTAKVKIDLRAGAGVTLGGTVSVQLLNVSGVENGQTTIRPYRPDEAVYSYLALLAEQTITANAQFIKVSVDGTDFYYKPTSSMTLEAGLVYTYTITVKANGIEVAEATSGAWTPGVEETVESIVFKTDLSTAKVGDFITTDGRLIEMKEGMTLSEEVKKKIAGVVFWTPAETTAEGRQTPASLQSDKVMAQAHPNCTHGLAVSLKNVSAGMQWQDPYKAVVSFQNGDAFNPDCDKNLFKPIASNYGSSDPINFILGYQNTLILRAYNVYCKSMSSGNKVVLPVDALAEFETNNPSPSNSTGWFLPSPKELHILCYKDVDDIWNKWDSSYTDTRDIVNKSLTAAGGETFANNYAYWSSSEHANNSNGAFYVNFNRASVNYSPKSSTRRVRAVCAF